MSALNVQPHIDPRQGNITTNYETIRNTPYEVQTETTDRYRLIAAPAMVAGAAATVVGAVVDLATNILTLGHGTSLAKSAAKATKEMASRTLNGKSEDIRHIEVELTEADQDEIDEQTRFTEDLIKEDIANDRYSKSKNGPYAYRTEIKTIELKNGRKLELSYFIYMPIDSTGKPDVSKAKRVKFFKLEDQKAFTTDTLLLEKATKWMMMDKALGEKGFGSCRVIVFNALDGTAHGYVRKPKGSTALDDLSHADFNFDKDIPKELKDKLKLPQKEGDKDNTPNGSTDETFHYKGFGKKSGPALDDVVYKPPGPTIEEVSDDESALLKPPVVPTPKSKKGGSSKPNPGPQPGPAPASVKPTPAPAPAPSSAKPAPAPQPAPAPTPSGAKPTPAPAPTPKPGPTLEPIDEDEDEVLELDTMKAKLHSI